MMPVDVRNTIFFYIYCDCEDANEIIPVTYDEKMRKTFSRNVITGEIHVQIDVKLVAPIASELHVIHINDDDEQQVMFIGESDIGVGVNDGDQEATHGVEQGNAGDDMG